MRRFVGELSPDSLGRRFLGTVDPAQAVRVLSRTWSPGDRLLVVEQGTPPAIVGHAACLMVGPGSAEGAFLVADAWQGRGLGTLLVSRVTEVAQAAGATSLVAETLPHNLGMLRAFERSGYPLEVRHSACALQVELRIAEPAPRLRLVA